jgi:hypothetical protein
MTVLALLICYLQPNLETLTIDRICSGYHEVTHGYQECQAVARRMRAAFHPPAKVVLHECFKAHAHWGFDLQGVPTVDDPRGSGGSTFTLRGDSNTRR